MYDLLVSGFLDFNRFATVLAKRTISRDPLSGVLDGVNRVFKTSYYPILTTGSLRVYAYSSGSVLGGTADYDSGEVVLDTAPSVQPEATYTYTPYTTTQTTQFLISGFDEMELRWSRGWQLMTTGSNPGTSVGDWTEATDTSLNIYVTDTTGSGDPLCGSVYFSKSRVQLALYMACCEYRMLLSQLSDHSINDIQYREGLRGMLVDATKRPPNIALALEAANKRIEAALARAMEQFYPDGDHYGGFQADPATRDYMAGHEWQTDSKDNDVRDTWQYSMSYNRSLRPLLGN